MWFWNSLLSSNNPLLENIVRADLLLANRSDTWTYRIRWKRQHNQPFAELQQQYTTYCRLRKKQLKKEKADEMVGLIDNRSPKVYKLMTAIKRTDISPISAESWTEPLQSHFVQPQESAPDLIPGQFNLPTRHYSVANCGLDKFFLPTLQSHPVLVEGTETWTLPFNVAMSEHLCMSYPLYILWLPPLKKHFKHEHAVQPRFWPFLCFFYQTRRQNGSGWSW